MDKTVPGKEVPDEVTRESLISISYSEPDRVPTTKLSSEKLNESPETGVYLFHFHLENSRISRTVGSILWILWYVVLLNCGDIKCVDFWSTCNALRVFLEVYIIVK
ncbi:hypothetical protein CFP56_018879 [Quercus suber]|uniref:Uncharacterized protein n=1 Tax=Quercus suber TaxID=58331 RepID=A0AAW0KK66_QUESU